MTLFLNKVTLAGNLGSDPRISTLQDGSFVATLSVASTEYWTDKKTGERNETTEWHRVIIWNQYLVKMTQERLKKGSAVYVEGKLETRKWQDTAGTTKTITEIVVRPWQGDMKPLERLASGTKSGNIANTSPPITNDTKPAPSRKLNDPVNAPISYHEVSGG